MHALSQTFRARLATGATTLACCWRIERRDGLVRGFTEHDGDLAFEGVVYRASTGLKADSARSSVDGGDRAEVLGVLDDAGIDEAGLESGLWDGARVDIWRVDWTDPQERVHVGAGRIGAIERRGAAFTAFLGGLDAPFDRAFGRVFSRFCDANVGDGRCGVTLAVAAFRGMSAVASVTGERAFFASGLTGFEAAWFTRGRLVWSGGAVSEVMRHSRFGDQVSFELTEATSALQAGAAFTVTAGCDKRLETCRAKFANAAAFRGFPHMPGADAMLASVDLNAPRDGGSRFR